MNQNLFHGHGIAAVTPMCADGAVDFPALEALLDDYATSPFVDFLCILGTTAETPTLSHQERRDVWTCARQVIARRKPVMLGCGGNCTATVCESVQSGEWDEADALLIVTPYYNRPSQEGLYAHYRAVAAAARRPIVFYNVPSRTGSCITLETIQRLLAACPGRFVAIKEAGGDIQRMAALREALPADFSVLCGDDALISPAMAAHLDGAVSVLGGLQTEIVGRMVQEGTPEPELLRTLTPLLFEEGNPAGIKCALAAQGRITEALRLPLVPVSDGLRQRISAAITL